jgi:glycerol-3-phosphate acyltransferase PlsY
MTLSAGDHAIEAILLIVGAYLLGSVPTGFLLGRLSGIDVRETGSGNVGATNVARTVGKWQGLLTLLGDTLKGFVPAAFGAWIGLSAILVLTVALVAFLGHLFPVFLNFRGGKGVATALGALLAVAPLGTLILLLAFLCVARASRLISLASVATALLAPVVLWLLSYSPHQIGFAAVMALLIVYRHRDNIRRLASGSEPQLEL